MGTPPSDIFSLDYDASVIKMPSTHAGMALLISDKLTR